ncbi:unnamed protein product [Cyclocybe aegerita]|uniref:HhH-GPD domain-containing protein n=1 Tax=Cyclocybe aegerita TaxID=1973307 RepID=A0A8S0W3R4_CYCAE|nr:unnamed protein product [Cyclocybe aegerita]
MRRCNEAEKEDAKMVPAWELVTIASRHTIICSRLFEHTLARYSRTCSDIKEPRPLCQMSTRSSSGPGLKRKRATPGSSQTAKKLKLQSSFVAESPFPDFEHPTPAEAKEVFNLLSKAHRLRDPERRAPVAGPNAAQTCGNVPNVIESLIGTILSQNTSGTNSGRAKTNLDAAFGRNNFAAIASAPLNEVVEAIRCGGLANKKAATIQKALRSIKQRHGQYSLQHLAAVEEGERMTDDDIMKELLAYDGVGPKTASCVLLFCLGRDSFAVDTHVFRLSKILGWVPPKADRILTQAHLDLRVPSELKYGLHVLMIQHGRACKGCKKIDSEESCILKECLKARKAEDGDDALEVIDDDED